jgi:hypothetical protein
VANQCAHSNWYRARECRFASSIYEQYSQRQPEFPRVGKHHHRREVTFSIKIYSLLISPRLFTESSSELALARPVQDNNFSGLFSVPLELILAAVASRSSLVGALLRDALPANRHIVLDFLQGLSRDELECLVEFHGACILEAGYTENYNSYRLISDFFDPAVSDRWRNPDDRAHKMFIVLAWLDQVERSPSIPFHPKPLKTA